MEQQQQKEIKMKIIQHVEINDNKILHIKTSRMLMIQLC